MREKIGQGRAEGKFSKQSTTGALMWYTIPQYKRSEIEKAGNILAKGPAPIDQISWALTVLSNFRACHNYPINTFQATLRMKLKKIDASALVARRLKRVPSIIRKLVHEKHMNLARMQDIGGLRAVVSSIDQVYSLYNNYKSSKFLHELKGEKDYIVNPKESGYRGIHLIYKYNMVNPASYNGLRLELQIRTQVQHAWATAVETVGTFIDHSLKSSEGPDEWLDFFKLASSAFALLEQCNVIEEHKGLSEDEIITSTASKAILLDVEGTLTTYSKAVQALPSKRQGSYYLLDLDPKTKIIQFTAYSKERLKQAEDDYIEIEKRDIEGSQRQVVLVAADSIEQLKKAYPNYFLDTHEFLRLLKRIEKKAAALRR